MINLLLSAMGFKSKILLFLIIALALFPSAAQLSASEKPTVYKIEFYRDGAAIWTIETRVKLESQLDLEAFNAYKAQFEANKSMNLGNFSIRITNIVNEASIATGRAMVARDFDVFLSTVNTPTGTYGIVSYRFTWTNFAKIEDDVFEIGDVFAGGLYLAREEALAITPPPGLEVKAASPKPDEIKDSTLIYYGMRSFANGEPRISLQQAIPTDYYILFAIIIIFAIIGGILLYKARKTRIEVSREEASEREAETEQVEIAQSDEDLILNLLEKARGEMYQSEIVEKTGFSKSKVSAILSDLKAKGLILKIKKGRENLIRKVK
ncbi:MAG: helix-turn-helix domain-containing protein [Methanocellales archaeon]